VADARGLAFNEDKTKIVSLSEGYDFPALSVPRSTQAARLRLCGVPR
jgi:hypothetical protein